MPSDPAAAPAPSGAGPTPADHVLAAFGLGGPVRPLAGGQGQAFVVDDVVLKRVDDPDEAAWVEERKPYLLY